ncbi:MAG: hypothetical protein ACI8X5_000670 [Planctomycetota bacterium]|jgi:hypothetical protein
MSASALQSLEIQVERRLSFQVKLLDETEADSFAVVGVSEEPIGLTLQRPGARRILERAPISRGVGDVVSVPGNAAQLLLFKSGKEVRRVDLSQSPNRVTVRHI